MLGDYVVQIYGRLIKLQTAPAAQEHMTCLSGVGFVFPTADYCASSVGADDQGSSYV